MYSELFEDPKDPYYNPKEDEVRTKSHKKDGKRYEYKYAQPTDYDEECLQREFFDIKDAFGGF